MRHNKKASRRWMLRLQSLSCLTLIFLMLFMSFGSLYSVDVKVSPDVQQMIDDVVDILNEVAVEKAETAPPPIAGTDTETDSQTDALTEELQSPDAVEIVFPEKVDVSLYTFIKLLFKLDDVTRIINDAISLYNSINDSQSYNYTLNALYSTMSDARALVTTEEFINTLALVVTVMYAFSESIFAGVGMIVMILMTVFLPLALWTLIFIMLFGSIFTVWSTDRWYFWMNKCFKAAVRIFAVVLAVMLASRVINLSWGLIISLLACVLGFAVAALLTRFKSRTREGIRYINVLQVCSAAKLVGFGIFFLCLAKANIIGRYATIMFMDLIGNILSQDYGVDFLKQFMFTLISLASIIALFAAFSTLMGTLSRVGGMQKRNKESCMFSTFMCGVLLFAPIIASLFYSRAALVNTNTKFVIGAFLGLMLMIFSEIAIPLGRKYLCKGLRESEKDAILRGLETVETEDFNAEAI